MTHRSTRPVGMLAYAIVAVAVSTAAVPSPGLAQGFGGFRGVRSEIQLVERFDRDGNGRLDAAERRAARESLGTMGGGGFGRGGFGRFGRRGFGGRTEATSPGPRLSPGDVKAFPAAPLYDISTLRTLFLEFEAADWERELADFHDTDVEVPARITVDGRVYRDVGVHFRGASSFMMVPEGSKRSLNLSFDFVHEDQRLYGYRTLNLLNAANDPTFLRTPLYAEIARHYLPIPKTNYVRVVINGESWGVYVNVQQFNSDFTRDWFDSKAGRRWHVPGSPGGVGGMEYLGDDPDAYRPIYEIKTTDDPASWAALIGLCRVLNQTPLEKLQAALAPILDVDGALKFLALEVALVNSDGYWARASDYNIYQDGRGRFHIVPHDFNEALGGEGGGGFMMAGRGGAELDPLVGLTDASKPLRSRLLSVPALRARYLEYVRDIATRWLDWKTLDPLARQYQALIAADVEADTRKLYSAAAFRAGLDGPGGGLKNFADRRRAFLLGDRPVATRP